MGKPITKENITKVQLLDRKFGNSLREGYQNTIMSDQPFTPKKLEYEDIDNAMKEMVEKELSITDNGNSFPTFTLFSGQRFSEYSQTWRHTDNDGNLLMNFKTIVRENNPVFGENQGGNYAIPGDRKYTALLRDVLDDNGVECYEVYTVKQPMTVSLMYRVSIFTDKFANLNKFNMMVNSLFKAKQFYIRPNGHYIPLLLSGVSDETTYGLEERKFFTQTYSITAEAYIILEDDIEVSRHPKRVSARVFPDIKERKPSVSLKEDGDDITITFTFPKGTSSVEFSADFSFQCETMTLSNVRWVKSDMGEGYISIGDGSVGFSFKEGDTVRLKVIPVSGDCVSEVVMNGKPLSEGC